MISEELDGHKENFRDLSIQYTHAISCDVSNKSARASV